jgi:DNA-binding IscR family transcriptional regulator
MQQRGVWVLVEEAIQEVLNATTIGDLVSRQIRLQVTARKK